MNHAWLKTTISIASLFAFRMLGLFMLIPIFTLYAPSLHDATPERIGFALGAYGLSQAVLQIPFGILSDRYGRKNLIALGFLLLAIGSIIGAVTHSIYGMIIARLLQGSGAIGSVLIALLADLTTAKYRTQAMAVIGVSIGLSFSIAMIISPILTIHYGLSGIFYFTLMLACVGMMLLYTIIPHVEPPKTKLTSWDLLKTSFCDLTLQRLNIGIFCQHFILTATFFAIPLLLQQYIKTGFVQHATSFYLPIMLLSFISMLPILVFAERKQQVKPTLLAAIVVIFIAQIALFQLSFNWVLFCSFIFMYFVAFNLLEAELPSMISKQANPSAKGAAMGIYSSSQFLGIFVGGGMAGIIFQHFSSAGIFVLNSGVALFWFIVMLEKRK